MLDKCLYVLNMLTSVIKDVIIIINTTKHAVFRITFVLIPVLL